MLAESAPWYLPAMIGLTVAWIAAPYVSQKMTQEGRLWNAYVWAPIILAVGLLLHRCQTIWSLDQRSREVGLVLGGASNFTERVQLLFNGQGGLEGAYLSVLIFAALCPRLPSLRNVKPRQQEEVQVRIMAHTGWWALLLATLLFPVEAYESLTSIPLQPTQALPGWSVFGSILICTLLLVMSGEIVASSAMLAHSRATTLLFQRAILKIVILLPLAWWLLWNMEPLSTSWWDRPDQHSLETLALIVISYATMVCFVHAPAAWFERSLGVTKNQSWSLGLTFLIVVACLFLTSRWMVGQLEGTESGMNPWLRAFGVTAAFSLFATAVMYLPSAGFDAAYRPELWWLRWALILILPIGLWFSNNVWVLLPGIFLAGGATLLLPWQIETHQHEMFKQRTLTMLAGAVILGVAIFVAAPTMLVATTLSASVLAILSVIFSKMGSHWLSGEPS